MKTAIVILFLGVAFLATVNARTIEFPGLNSELPKPSLFQGLAPQADGCTCGERRSSRIVGGTAAQSGQFPWRVRVCSGSPGSRSCSSCGATIISEKWILTAAHCFNTFQSVSEIKIYVGSTDPNGIVVTPDRLIIHERYRPLTIFFNSQNDIALLSLKEKLSFDNSSLPLGPACLPYQYVGKEELGIMIASGWGKTNGTDNGSSAKTLQTVELDVISNNDCQKMDRRITKTQVCANTPKKSVCQGDSGGSIDKVSNELSYAFGVVSYGPQNCDGYGVFTRVSEYITWIEQRTGETFCKP